MRRALSVALPLTLVLALSIWRSFGPAPLDTTAPENVFSGMRARAVQEELLAEGVPHPVGSAANMRVRERIEARFRALGYETSVQRRFVCNAYAACAAIENVIARLPGASSGDIVLMAAHYDSVAAGPGASDDSLGVASQLEVARAIRNDTLRNRVAFLVTDAEEVGLLGAEAFAADETLLRDVAVVVNLDMRGTYGTSNMFETSRGNRWLIRHLAGALERPQASSFFYTIYTLLPNDTDVTVFKRAGKAAVNFAAIGGVKWYHTPFDDLAHSSPRTLQHHGENALAAMRAFGDADLAARSKTDATYFDVLGFFLLWWPQEWTLWIAIVSLLALLFAARKAAPRVMTFGVLAAFATVLFAALGGVGMSWIVRLRSADTNWVAHPLAAILALALTGIAAALFAAALFNRRNDARGMLFGIAIVWHMIGIALAITLPGTAYLMIVPAVAFTICALAKASDTVTSVVTSTIGAIVIFPIAIMIYEALGGRLIAALALVAGIFVTLIAPLFARARNAVAAIGLAIVCAIIAIALPAFTREKPQTVQLFYVADPKPHWVTWNITDSLRKAAPFKATDASQSMPWNAGTVWTAPAPDLRVPPVSVSGERTANGVKVRVTTNRDAGRVSLFFRGGTLRSVNGVAPTSKPQRGSRLVGDWQYASANGVKEIVVEIAAKGRVEVVGSDTGFGFPPEGAALKSARDASPAIPIQDGDVTVTRTRATF